MRHCEDVSDPYEYEAGEVSECRMPRQSPALHRRFTPETPMSHVAPVSQRRPRPLASQLF